MLSRIYFLLVKLFFKIIEDNIKLFKDSDVDNMN